MKLISSVEKYRNDLFWVTEDHAVEPGGFEIKRGIVQHRGSAVMLAVDDKKRILLVQQYRLPARKFLWELPAGRLDEGEKPLQAAKRELKEETGYSARTWKKLVEFYPSPGFVAEKMTIFLATDLKEGEATPMDDERIEMQWFPAREVEQMIAAGKIIDGKTMIGYCRWRSEYGGRKPQAR
ncbi:MAG TPA: NUDIX hydrolase [Bryobacteraceae bacterium]|nr:NUDIX hydrolase [Bryobacteraceae bacterium]